MEAEKVKAPAEVRPDQGEGGNKVEFGNDDFTSRKPKRKLGNVWYEDGGRYLFRSGANGTTVFDVWKLIGAPLLRRGRL